MTPRSHRILVILDDAGPGDALRSRFVLSSLRAANSDAFITLLVSEQACDVFSGDTSIDRIVVSGLYRRGIEGAWRRRAHKLAEMARLMAAVGIRHDLVLVLGWGTLALDLLARGAGRTVIGYENRFGFLTSTNLGAYDVDGDPVEQNYALLLASGVTGAGAAAGPEGVDVPREPYAILHTGSDWACQQWRPECWAEVGDWLVEQGGLAVLFTGVADEADYVAGIRARMRNPSKSLAGSTSFEQLTSLIRRAELVVTVDSSPYEVAQLMGTPVVVLAGPTSAAPRMRGAGQVLVINRTRLELRSQILACQRTFADGRCHDYACPFSQLPLIRTGDVIEAIRSVRAGNVPVVASA